MAPVEEALTFVETYHQGSPRARGCTCPNHRRYVNDLTLECFWRWPRHAWNPTCRPGQVAPMPTDDTWTLGSDTGTIDGRGECQQSGMGRGTPRSALSI